MYAFNKYMRSLVTGLLTIVAILCTQSNLFAQDTISVYQFRHVAPEHMEEFIKRETTYWSEVARKSMEKGNIIFWAMFQKSGGFDMPNSPNILFINTYVNVDNIADTWANPNDMFPDVKMEDMETNSMSTTMHTAFVKAQNWVEKAGAVPENDYNYIKITYHSSSAPGQYVNLERDHWGPFIKKTMDEGKTRQTAWGNAIILSPRGPAMKYNSISYDLYASMNDALIGGMSPDVELPTELFDKLAEIQLDRRLEYVYNIVKVVQPDNAIADTTD